ncbi:hypothetical protein FRC14_006535, partial [Serendipita sp. 396]
MTKRFTYVIEHMEEDEPDSAPSSLPQWVLLEYKHMLSFAGEGSTVIFNHLSRSSCSALDSALSEGINAQTKVSDYPSRKSVASHQSSSLTLEELMKSHNIGKERICLLDPKSPIELSPNDGDGIFDWFLFGGILGDDPPRDRTGELRTMGFPTRHLGPVQMTTDTALGVTKMVVKDDVPLNSIPYIDRPTIQFSSNES